MNDEKLEKTEIPGNDNFSEKSPEKENSDMSTSSSSSTDTIPPAKTSDLKIILTGATGFVGEGVLLSTLDNPAVAEVLIVTRRPYIYKKEPAEKHPSGKLKNIIVEDFFNLEDPKIQAQLTGYDACFYCAGKSSVGMNEADYTRLTYDMVIYFATTVLKLNQGMTMCHISGGNTDSTEQGKVMWARVKGKAENALMRMPFRGVYNFRPSAMKARKEQSLSVGHAFISGIMYPLFKSFMPRKAVSMQEIGTAMVNCVVKGYPLHVLENLDIVAAAAASS